MDDQARYLYHYRPCPPPEASFGRYQSRNAHPPRRRAFWHDIWRSGSGRWPVTITNSGYVIHRLCGSAQFIMTQLFALNTPALVIVVTAFLVNLRHGLYSASVAPYVNHLTSRWRQVLSYFLTDEAYAVTIIHYRQKEERPEQRRFKHWFFLGSGLALWTTWQISTAVGILAGALIPETWPLAFFIPLTFIALVVPNLEDWPTALAALTGGVVSILAFNLPFRLGLIVASFVGSPRYVA